MSSISESFPLPTLDRLGAVPPKNIDVDGVGRAWIRDFSSGICARDVHTVVTRLLHPEPWWRDLFALTWDMRSFQGRDKIQTFLQDRLDETQLQNVRFLKAVHQTPYPDLVWILVQFSFETAVGYGRGDARIVYCADNSWRAVTVYTNLEGLHGHPERLGVHRDHNPDHGNWAAQRELERSFKDKDPEVLIIGGGQSGLEAAARLNALGVSNLVVEKSVRIGDSWRTRYENLSLHGPIWQNPLPYLQFPPSWPVFIPAGKFANWLELYADTLDLNVWTSTCATRAVRDEKANKWEVTVKQSDGSERTMRVDHMILAFGYPFKWTRFPGQTDFRGEIIYSSDFRSAKNLVGRRVVVVGACASAHDAASDCADHGIDVTMFQRSSTYVMSISKGMMRTSPSAEWEAAPTEDVDRNKHSLPVHFAKHLAQRSAEAIRADDSEMLEGLRAAGYRTSRGEENAGPFFHLLRGGGYYLDRGACQQIIDGKIKIKSGGEIERLTNTSIRFSDGSEIDTDVVIIATGFDDVRVLIRDLVGDELASKVSPIWDLNQEGEITTVYRDSEAVPNMWTILGNLAYCRFFSKHVALQIKAKQQRLFGARYSTSV